MIDVTWEFWAGFASGMVLAGVLAGIWKYLSGRQDGGPPSVEPDKHPHKNVINISLGDPPSKAGLGDPPSGPPPMTKPRGRSNMGGS